MLSAAVSSVSHRQSPKLFTSWQPSMGTTTAVLVLQPLLFVFMCARVCVCAILNTAWKISTRPSTLLLHFKSTRAAHSPTAAAIQQHGPHLAQAHTSKYTVPGTYAYIGTSVLPLFILRHARDFKSVMSRQYTGITEGRSSPRHRIHVVLAQPGRSLTKRNGCSVMHVVYIILVSYLPGI